VYNYIYIYIEIWVNSEWILSISMKNIEQTITNQLKLAQYSCDWKLIKRWSWNWRSLKSDWCFCWVSAQFADFKSQSWWMVWDRKRSWLSDTLPFDLNAPPFEFRQKLWGCVFAGVWDIAVPDTFWVFILRSLWDAFHCFPPPFKLLQESAKPNCLWDAFHSMIKAAK